MQLELRIFILAVTLCTVFANSPQYKDNHSLKSVKTAAGRSTYQKENEFDSKYTSQQGENQFEAKNRSLSSHQAEKEFNSENTYQSSSNGFGKNEEQLSSNFESGKSESNVETSNLELKSNTDNGEYEYAASSSATEASKSSSTAKSAVSKISEGPNSKLYQSSYNNDNHDYQNEKKETSFVSKNGKNLPSGPHGSLPSIPDDLEDFPTITPDTPDDLEDFPTITPDVPDDLEDFPTITPDVPDDLEDFPTITPDVPDDLEDFPTITPDVPNDLEDFPTITPDNLEDFPTITPGNLADSPRTPTRNYPQHIPSSVLSSHSEEGFDTSSRQGKSHESHYSDMDSNVTSESPKISYTSPSIPETTPKAPYGLPGTSLPIESPSHSNSPGGSQTIPSGMSSILTPYNKESDESPELVQLPCTSPSSPIEKIPPTVPYGLPGEPLPSVPPMSHSAGSFQKPTGLQESNYNPQYPHSPKMPQPTPTYPGKQSYDQIPHVNSFYPQDSLPYRPIKPDYESVTLPSPNYSDELDSSEEQGYDTPPSMPPYPPKCKYNKYPPYPPTNSYLPSFYPNSRYPEYSPWDQYPPQWRKPGPTFPEKFPYSQYYYPEESFYPQSTDLTYPPIPKGYSHQPMDIPSYWPRCQRHPLPYGPGYKPSTYYDIKSPQNYLPYGPPGIENPRLPTSKNYRPKLQKHKPHSSSYQQPELFVSPLVPTPRPICNCLEQSRGITPPVCNCLNQPASPIIPYEKVENTKSISEDFISSPALPSNLPTHVSETSDSHSINLETAKQLPNDFTSPSMPNGPIHHELPHTPELPSPIPCDTPTPKIPNDITSPIIPNGSINPKLPSCTPELPSPIPSDSPCLHPEIPENFTSPSMPNGPIHRELPHTPELPSPIPCDSPTPKIPSDCTSPSMPNGPIHPELPHTPELPPPIPCDSPTPKIPDDITSPSMPSGPIHPELPCTPEFPDSPCLHSSSEIHLELPSTAPTPFDLDTPNLLDDLTTAHPHSPDNSLHPSVDSSFDHSQEILPCDSSSNSSSNSESDESPLPHRPKFPPKPCNKNLPDDTLSYVLKDLEEGFQQAKLESLKQYASFPKDMTEVLEMAEENTLSYSTVIVGTHVSALSALKTLLDHGKRVLLIDNVKLTPSESKSLYHRIGLIGTPYVSSYPATAPGCDVDKKIYVSNVIGGTLSYDFGVWDHGARNKYDKWANTCENWSWSTLSRYYKELEKIEDVEGSCGPISVSSDIPEISATTMKLIKAFDTAGISETIYDINSARESPGLIFLPAMHDNTYSSSYAQRIFDSLKNKENLHMALGIQPTHLVFDAGRVVAVEFVTPAGIVQTIRVEEELILSYEPVNTAKLLQLSGCGDSALLEQLQIPVQHHLPHVGKDILLYPMYPGLVIKCPSESLLEAWDSDLSAVGNLFKETSMQPSVAMSYYKAFLQVQDAEEANLQINVFTFSKRTIQRLKYFMRGLFNFEEDVQKYLLDLCASNDIMFMVPQLLDTESKAEVYINTADYTAAPVINTHLYESGYDLLIMKKAVSVIRRISKSLIKQIGGELVQVPTSHCGKPSFGKDYLECSIRHLTVAGLHLTGGASMGRDKGCSVVDNNLRVHGVRNLYVLSSAVVPQGVSADSSAISTVIGTYGAELIVGN